MNKIFVMTACAVMSVTAMSAQTSPLPVYRDASRPLDERVEDALSRMTTQEKIDIIHAQSKFSSRGVPPLGRMGAGRPDK